MRGNMYPFAIHIPASNTKKAMSNEEYEIVRR